jgi:hypothetical protein
MKKQSLHWSYTEIDSMAIADSIVPFLKRENNRLRRIDRLRWTDALLFETYGIRFAIRMNDAAFMADLNSCLPPVRKVISVPVIDICYSLKINQSGSSHLLYRNSQKMVRTRSRSKLYRHLEHALEWDLAMRAKNKIFVHAGVVGWRGEAILIPGRSMSGKTSMVNALLNAGATYYSDEFAVLDQRGRVYPYPRSLRIRQDTPTNMNSGSRIRTGKKPLPVGLVASMRYKPGARWRPRFLSPSEAMMILLRNTIPARSRPDESMTFLKAACGSARAMKTDRDEAGPVAEILLEYLQKPY